MGTNGYPAAADPSRLRAVVHHLALLHFPGDLFLHYRVWAARQSGRATAPHTLDQLADRARASLADASVWADGEHGALLGAVHGQSRQVSRGQEVASDPLIGLLG